MLTFFSIMMWGEIRVPYVLFIGFFVTIYIWMETAICWTLEGIESKFFVQLIAFVWIKYYLLILITINVIAKSDNKHWKANILCLLLLRLVNWIWFYVYSPAGVLCVCWLPMIMMNLIYWEKRRRSVEKAHKH